MDQLELMASELNATPEQLALAWGLHKGVFPIIGARTLAHLESSLRAAAIGLSADQLQVLDELSAIQLGYPHDLLASVQKN
ncbi:hypothetical protein GCM10028773_12590 [Spirosoma koreense]